MRIRNRRGVTLLEVLTAAIVGTLMSLPVITLLATSTHESMVSEDYMFAEALAQRYLAEALSIPWGDLQEQLPLDVPISGIPEEDKAIAMRFPAYAKNISGDFAFKGKLTANELKDDIVKFEVSLTWPVKPGSSTNRKYAVIRFRCRHDIAVSTNFPLPVSTPGKEKVGW